MLSLTRKTPDPIKALTPAQAERAAEAERIALEGAIRLREIQEAAAFKAELVAKERDAERAKLKTADKETKARAWSDTGAAWASRVVPFLPLVQVNALAVFGQLGWGRTHLTQVGESINSPARWAVAILFAATLESIALFLAYYANRALNRGDSATALYLAAFGVAGVVAGINYSHYAHPKNTITLLTVDIPSPTPMGIVFALCSLASPWLWRIKHRDANRNELHKLGVIDTKAPRLSMARKLWHPIRSFKVMWYATWDGEQEPAKAIARYETIRQQRTALRAEAARTRPAWFSRKAVPAASEASQSAVETAPGVDVQDEVPAALEAPELPALPPAPAGPALPPEALGNWAPAWKAFAQSVEAGNPLSARGLAKVHLKGNRRHADTLMGAYNAWKEAHANGNSPRPATQ